jgi:hypothetical protein
MLALVVAHQGAHLMCVLEEIQNLLSFGTTVDNIPQPDDQIIVAQTCFIQQSLQLEIATMNISDHQRLHGQILPCEG